MILFEEQWETIKAFKQGMICDFNPPSPYPSKKKKISLLFWKWMKQDKNEDRMLIKRHLQLSRQQSQRFRISAELLIKAILALVTRLTKDREQKQTTSEVK